MTRKSTPGTDSAIASIRPITDTASKPFTFSNKEKSVEVVTVEKNKNKITETDKKTGKTKTWTANDEETKNYLGKTFGAQAAQQFQSWLEQQFKATAENVLGPAAKNMGDMTFNQTSDSAKTGRNTDMAQADKAREKWQEEHGFFGPAEPGRKN